MKIKKITNGVDSPTWDIEVPEHHEFLLSNGVVTHNTSQILGNNESFEPFHSNIFLRRTISGEFAVVNRYLVEELIKINLWNDKIRYRIIGDKGSVQNIVEIPEEIRDRFKTIWEIKQKDLVEMAADRGKYICQTQSMNLYIKNPNFAKMTSALFYCW